ncbi:MAG: peptide ABC transporter substrate-binding protein [Xanthomonadaceae bacterium]|nr:peptide ABC transporter substrate-binding protein [Xanthomonadaceae bacterium]
MSHWFSILALILSFNSVFAEHSAKKFSFRLSGEPETLDWNLAHTSVETHLMMNMMDGLVTLDNKLNVKPMLATEWAISSDQKVYTFTLRKNVKWSDGVELKASHFVDGWKRLLSRETGASYSYLLFDLVGAQEYFEGKISDFTKVGVKALGAYKLQVTLKNPVPYWITIPSFWVTFPIRSDLIKKYGKKWTKPGNLVTLGILVLEKYEIDHKLDFKTNPYYWNLKTNVEEWSGIIIKDENTAVSLYQSGRLDFVNDLPILSLKNNQNNPELKEFAYLKTVYLGFAVTRPEVANAGLRRAIAMAIDKSKFAEILYGRQKPASSFVPPPLFASGSNLGLPFSIERAKNELKKIGTLPKNIELLIPNVDKNMMVAQYIQGELKKNLGLEIAIQTYDYKTYRKHMESQSESMFMASWGADYPDPDNFLSVFLSQSGNNRTLFKDDPYDSWVIQARSISNQKKREELYEIAQKRMLQDYAPIIPLYYEPNLVYVKPSIEGLLMDPMNNLDLRQVKVKN